MRRIYGDFSGPHLRSWEKKLAGLAVIPHQQFAYTKGKNSSDIALVIDAMDLMHTGRFDGFVMSPPTATSPDWRAGSASRACRCTASGRRTRRRRVRHREGEHAGGVPQGVQAVHLRREPARRRGGATGA